jgi:ABC-type multidrug transport system fused ATPase/permease subunit
MATFYRLLRFLTPYKRGLIASILLSTVAMVMTVALPHLTGLAVERIDVGSRATQLHHAAARSHDLRVLLELALSIVAVVLVRWALTYARRMVAGRISLGIEYDLRELLYAHLQRLELAFFDRQQTGQLMSRVTVDLQAVRFFLGYGLVFILQSALTILLAGAAMIASSPELGLIAIAPVPFVVVIASRYGRRARPAIQDTQQRIAELTADAEENISGVRVVKAFAREGHQLQRFEGSVARVFDQSMVATRLEARYNPMIGFLPQLGLAAVLLIGGQSVIHAHLSLGQFTAFYFYLNMLISPMRTLGVTLGLAQRATASGARIFQVLDREPELTEAPDAAPLPFEGGEVELRKVTLAYGEGAEDLARRAPAELDGHAPSRQRRPVLRDVDLHVPAGSTVAIVGGTGSGKTSLVSLLPRLYDVTEGAVLIDGVDVRRLRLTELRRAIAIVSDDPFLFSASVAENIAYGRPEATREEIELAASRAQALEFIRELPDGMQTRVGERGLTLSGGQRQRLAIARALLADPRILVLDDATSSVDASTEQQIKLALTEAMRGRTTFVISHRLSTISLAQRIVVLEAGKIVAAGEHEELIESSELYKEIVEQGAPAPRVLYEQAEDGESALARREASRL